MQTLLLVHEVAAAKIEFVLLDGVLDVHWSAVAALFALLDVPELVLELVAVAAGRLGGQRPLEVRLHVFVLGSLDFASLAMGIGAFVESLLRHGNSLAVLQTLEVHHVHGLRVVATRWPQAAAFLADPAVDGAPRTGVVAATGLKRSLAALRRLHLHLLLPEVHLLLRLPIVWQRPAGEVPRSLLLRCLGDVALHWPSSPRFAALLDFLVRMVLILAHLLLEVPIARHRLHGVLLLCLQLLLDR